MYPFRVANTPVPSSNHPTTNPSHYPRPVPRFLIGRLASTNHGARARHGCQPFEPDRLTRTVETGMTPPWTYRDPRGDRHARAPLQRTSSFSLSELERQNDAMTSHVTQKVLKSLVFTLQNLNFTPGRGEGRVGEGSILSFAYTVLSDDVPTPRF